jgi:hypothetical protein
MQTMLLFGKKLGERKDWKARARHMLTSDGWWKGKATITIEGGILSIQ